MDIAIIGMGCWPPGASNPRQLWENVLARRREFRRMPDARTPLSDYYDPTGNDPDKFYQSKGRSDRRSGVRLGVVSNSREQLRQHGRVSVGCAGSRAASSRRCRLFSRYRS